MGTVRENQEFWENLWAGSVIHNEGNEQFLFNLICSLGKVKINNDNGIERNGVDLKFLPKKQAVRLIVSDHRYLWIWNISYS